MTFAASWLVLSAITGRAVSQALSMDIAARQGDSTQSVQLVFDDFGQLTTCRPSLIRWSYFGPDEELSLYISNIGLSQFPSTTSEPPSTFTNTFIDAQPNLQRREDIYRPIELFLRPASEQYNWTSVNVPAGFYVINVYVKLSTSPAYQTQSSPFLVQKGDDTSCLSTTLPSSSSSPSSLPPATSTNPTSAPAPTSSEILLPSITPISASSSSTNKGAIAGGVTAGVFVLVVALALYLLFVRRPQRSRARNRGPSAFPHSPSKGTFGSAKGGGGGRWGGLSSVDSHMAMNDTAYTNQKPRTNRYVQQDSLGHTVGVGVAPRDGSPTYTSGNRSLTGLDDEKFLDTETAVVPKREASSQPRRPSTESSASNMLSPFATPPASSPVGLARAPSTGSTVETPVTSHRTPRKPVPAYIPNPSLESLPPVSTPASPNISTGSPFDPSVALPPAGGGGHYVTRAERESLKLASSGEKKSKRRQSKGRDKAGTKAGDSASGSSEDVQHSLAHKNSFGPGGVEGKPLHYLIPDMPAGQQ